MRSFRFYVDESLNVKLHPYHGFDYVDQSMALATITQ
jgi:hypothetical protein